MAERHWVGGSAAWDATAGTKWALTNGGAGGEAVPTSADDVYFDSGSGNVAVTSSTSVNCKNLTMTGFTGTYTPSSLLNIYGDAVLNSTFAGSSCSITMYSAGASTFTQNGASIRSLYPQTDETNGKVTLQDDLTVSAYVVTYSGELDTNNVSISCLQFRSDITTYNRKLTLGTSYITITGTGNTWRMIATKLTIDADQTTIKFTNSSTTAKNFIGGYTTYGTFWNATGNTGTVVVTGNNTFSVLKSDVGRVWRMLSGDTQTLASASGFQMTGSAGNLVSINGYTAGSAYTLSCASGDVVGDYLSLKDSTASGGATFYAGSHSTNTSGNSGWSFSDPPAPPTGGNTTNFFF